MSQPPLSTPVSESAASELTICDCHIHSFTKGITRPGASYAPPELDVSDYLPQEAQANGITRAVIIQASVDGTDNRALAQAVSTPPAGMDLRGVAMIDPEDRGNETAPLRALADAGIVAARVQDRGRLGMTRLESLPQIAARAATVGWHIELNTEPARFDTLAQMLGQMPEGQDLVLDHLGHIDPRAPAQIDALSRLLDTGRVYVKLSPTRITEALAKADPRQPASGQAAALGSYGVLADVVGHLTQGWSERCIWGSDWPHVMMPPPLPRIEPMLDLCRNVMDTTALHRVLEENPARLYRF